MTSVLVYGKGYADDAKVRDKDIVLNYDENGISVNFSDFNYDSDHLYQYYYLIEGLNKEWIPIPVGENRVIFTAKYRTAEIQYTVSVIQDDMSQEPKAFVGFASSIDGIGDEARAAAEWMIANVPNTTCFPKRGIQNCHHSHIL